MEEVMDNGNTKIMLVLWSQNFLLYNWDIPPCWRCWLDECPFNNKEPANVELIKCRDCKWAEAEVTYAEVDKMLLWGKSRVQYNRNNKTVH
jgi:hypothetical protein